MDYFTIIKRLGLFQEPGSISPGRNKFPPIVPSNSTKIISPERLLNRIKSEKSIKYTPIPSIPYIIQSKKSPKSKDPASLSKNNPVKPPASSTELLSKQSPPQFFMPNLRIQQPDLYKRALLSSKIKDSSGISGWSRSSSFNFSKL